MKYHNQIPGHLRVGVVPVGREVTGLVLEILFPTNELNTPV